jgi:hypothetical protein
MDLSSGRRAEIQALVATIRSGQPQKENFIKFVRVLIVLVKPDFQEEEVIIASNVAYYFFISAPNRVLRAQDWQACFYARKALVQLYDERINFKKAAESCGLTWAFCKYHFVYQMVDDMAREGWPAANYLISQLALLGTYTWGGEGDDIKEGCVAYLTFINLARQWVAPGETNLARFRNDFQHFLEPFCIAPKDKDGVVAYYVPYISRVNIN